MVHVATQRNARVKKAVEKRTLVNCEEFVSIQLKSSEGTIGTLLKKAVSATQLRNLEEPDNKLGIQ